MKIVDAKVIVCCPGRNFVTLKLLTEDGIHGLGDATLNGRELAVASYLSDHLLPLLIGRDARRIEDTWQYLYKGAYWRRGPVTMSAIAAVDTALWDIRAKSLGVPLYELLGGASRDGVLVYGHASGTDIEKTVGSFGHFLSLGYKAVRAQSGVPGLSSTYGTGGKQAGLGYEPAEKEAPLENQGRRYPLSAALRACEKIWGSHAMPTSDRIEAGRLGKELEPFHLVAGRSYTCRVAGKFSPHS
jgi:mannonate dehydratase